MTVVGWVAAGLLASVLLALGVGRAIRIADDPDDVWGCDECAAEAEQAALLRLAMLRHPSSRAAREVAELESWWAAS